MLFSNLKVMARLRSQPFLDKLGAYVNDRQAILGPIVMSLSEMIAVPSIKENQITEIRNNQEKLSNITDMMHTAYSIHRTILDIDKTKSKYNDSVSGQLLVGDFLLAQSSFDMSSFRIPSIVMLFSRSLEDYTTAEYRIDEFWKSSDKSNKKAFNFLTENASLTCGSLMSSSCLATSLLAGHQFNLNDRLKIGSTSNILYSFGHHIGTAQRLNEYLYQPKINSYEENNILIDYINADDFIKLIHNHIDNSIDLLSHFGDSKAKTNLIELIISMRNSNC